MRFFTIFKEIADSLIADCKIFSYHCSINHQAMKIICAADAFVTPEMMEEGVRPRLSEGDEMQVFFFGYGERAAMRDLVKTIESYSKAPAFAIDNYLGFLEGKELKFRVNI